MDARVTSNPTTYTASRILLWDEIQVDARREINPEDSGPTRKDLPMAHLCDECRLSDCFPKHFLCKVREAGFVTTSGNFKYSNKIRKVRKRKKKVVVPVEEVRVRRRAIKV